MKLHALFHTFTTFDSTLFDDPSCIGRNSASKYVVEGSVRVPTSIGIDALPKCTGDYGDVGSLAIGVNSNNDNVECDYLKTY